MAELDAELQVQQHHRLRGRARPNRGHVPRAARIDHPSAYRRDDYAWRDIDRAHPAGSPSGQAARDAIAKIRNPTAAALAKGIKASFKQKADREWRHHIEAEAKKRISKI